MLPPEPITIAPIADREDRDRPRRRRTPGSGSPATSGANRAVDAFRPRGRRRVRLGVHLGHDPGFEAGRHRLRRRGQRQHVGDLLEGAHLVPADHARRQVLAKRLGLRRLERPKDVRGRVGAAVMFFRHRLPLRHTTNPAGSPSAIRIFVSASRMRPFTVPAGSFSISAIWVWLNPPK